MDFKNATMQEQQKTTLENQKPTITEHTTTPRIITMWEHKSWGNSIYFTNYGTRELTGHLTPLPKKGDILRSKMNSGKIGVFRIEKVEAVGDPRDMFYATASDLGLN